VTSRRVGRAPEGGFVVAEFVLGVAVLVLPVALLVLSLPVWAEHQATARAIAREVGRTIARDDVCDLAQARATAEIMGGNLGLDRGEVHVDLDCAQGLPLAPGGSVRVEVTVAMPALEVPGIGRVGGWSWTARHTEPVDVYVGAP
jgi:hypothetical protein